MMAREAAGAGLLPGAGGLGVRLLRLAEPAALGPGDPACLADRCHPPVHTDSRQTYGSRRIHAELTLGRGISVGFHAVELLMRRAGLQGVTGRPRYRRGLRPEATARDLVQRQFARTGPDQLWVTDITEHPPVKASSTARWCWTPAHDGWSAGRLRPPRPRRW
jgi:transposase InsO family protein